MFLPLRFQDLGLESVTIGSIWVLSSVSAVSGTLAGARHADARGRKTILTAGYPIAAAGLALMIPRLAPLSFMGFLLSSFGLGLAGPAGAALLTESSPKDAMGISFAFATVVLPSLPPALTVMLGAYLYGYLYEIDLLVALAAFLVVASLYKVRLSETLVSQPNPGLAKREGVVKSILSLQFFLLLSAFVVASLPGRGIGWYLPLYLVGRGIQAWDWGVMTSVSTIAAAVGGLASGKFVDRIGPLRVAVISWISASVALYLLTATLQFQALVAVYALYMFFGIMQWPAGTILIARNYESEKRATALGYLGVMRTNVPTVVGPAVATASLAWGSAAPFAVGSTLYLLAALLLVAAHRVFSMRRERAPVRSVLGNSRPSDAADPLHADAEIARPRPREGDGL